ncbi:hypothetical protein [Tenacibaculum jejuense]|uniref:Secretion system C-terminal sorting domain-containing protein n=1 Tax=Tenacibaculum jejuense TaxID=584609 RepID=A0A238UA28_9FLAO|nr:hypothetical protein [Tenacibaculum jejuense]SNR16063.1 Protein of unknown function precursor [Tenacibaculum jejuense]
MKKFLLFTSLLLCFYSFAHRVDIGYEIVNLSSNYRTAKNIFCNQNPNLLNKRKINLISDGNHEELTVGKMFWFENDGNPMYIYIARKNASSFRDRDSFLFSDFRLQNFICEDTKSYDARNLGTNAFLANQIYCNQNPATAGSRMDLNVSEPRGSSRLAPGKIYKFNDEGTVRYIYIVRTRNGEFRDRDTFSKSDFSLQNITCEDTKSYDARNLGTNAFLANQIYCNQNPATAGSRMDLNVGEPRGSSRLTPGKIYKFNDEGTVRYIYIVRTRNGEFRDRDTFSKSDFSLQNIICEDTKSYDARNLGTNPFIIQNIYCNQNPATAGSRMDLNVSEPKGSNRLISGRIYRFNDEGTIRYVYIIRSRSGEFRDRDTFSKSDFTLQNYFCEDDYDDFLRKITIYNKKGIKVKEQKINHIDEEKSLLKTLPKGLYFIKDDNGNSKKIFKQN